MKTGPLPLYPMRVGDVLDGAFKLLKANARVVMIVSAVFLVPVHVLSAYLQRDLFGGRGVISIVQDPSTVPLEGNDAGQVWASVLVLAATIFVLPFLAGAVSRVVAASYLGQEIGPGEALRALRGKWVTFVVAWFLVHVVEVIGAVMCLLPGLIAMALFMAVAPVIAVEGLGAVRAMRRSARLVRPRLWPVLGIGLLSALISNAVSAALGFVPNTVAVLIGLQWGWILVALGSVVPALVTTPFVAIVATLVYFDGRIRQEGLDLQVMAAEAAR